MRIVQVITIAFALVTTSVAHAATREDGSRYAASDLLRACQEADNDARAWGQVAELECEQYILGYVEALEHVGAAGAGGTVCPPALNTADEVRWAFMRWVHKAYSERVRMSAAEALQATLEDSFACG